MTEMRVVVTEAAGRICARVDTYGGRSVFLGPWQGSFEAARADAEAWLQQFPQLPPDSATGQYRLDQNYLVTPEGDAVAEFAPAYLAAGVAVVAILNAALHEQGLPARIDPAPEPAAPPVPGPEASLFPL